jgi:hypothetical protein
LSDQLREALKMIGDVVNAAMAQSARNGDDGEHAHEDHDDDYDVGCSIRSLPPRLARASAEVARRINPVNAPFLAAESASDGVTPIARLTLLRTKYWGPAPRRLTVSFMETTPADLRKRIVEHMNAWTRTIGISFVETTGVGQVRISRGQGGYWSYLGTDVLLIPQNRPTMNLQGFSMSTPESEYKRVVRHETGHTLGFPHEHMRKALVDRIDPEKAYEYFWRTQGWDQQMVDQQVLTPLSQASILGTPADQTSIMCYQLPGLITTDGKPIKGGTDINATDYGFAGKVYPRPKAKAAAAAPAHEHEHVQADWDASEDIAIDDALAA